MKKWIAGLTGAVLISLCGTGLLLPAAAAPEAAESGEIGVNREMRRQDWMEKQKAAGEKWSALTQEQKEEIYALMDSRAAADAALIDKLAELGVIDQADADRIKQHMQEGLAEIKESGDFPMGHQRSTAPRKENQGEQG